MSSDSPRLRLGILGIVAVSLFATLFARLYFLQVLEAPAYRVAAETNRVRTVSLPAPRGRILDAEGRVLVDNRSSVVVTLDREVLAGLDEAGRVDLLARLSPVIGVAVPDIERMLADQRISPFSPVPVAEDVTEDVFVRLREQRDVFPGVGVEERAVRAYPNGPVAAHVLGYVGEINDTELEAREEQGYALGDTIGKAGAERRQETDLRGDDGTIELEVDATGRVLRELGRTPPAQGDDVQLTLDLDVQRVAEEALAAGLEEARRHRFADDDTWLRARAGSVVVLDATDGSVVAMASYPTYDPSAFVNGISSEAYAALTDPEAGTPFNNWAIQGEYAPGSTFKLVSAVAALRTGLLQASTTVRDTGSYRVPQCEGKCVWRNAGSVPFGPVDVRRAMTVSSDVYFYSLANDFWERRNEFGETPMQDVAAELGFGEVTGVGLPAEGDGRLPTPELKRRLHEQRPDAFIEGRWFVGDNLNLSIGQGELLVTPLQLANSYATFANGGRRFVPRLTAAVRTRDGVLVREEAPQVAGEVALPPAVRQPLLDGLRGVVDQGRGTASQVFEGFPLDRWPIAGKTGTAQVTGRQDSALFVAFGPADAPRYVVGVVMEESGFGADAAAPVARAVFEELAGVAQEGDGGDGEDEDLAETDPTPEGDAPGAR
jgi:penicillin-binding protein 2